MNRYIRYAALIGSCLVGFACEQGTAPEPSNFIPRATLVPASSVKIDSRIAGLSWDPEAYFIALAGCQTPDHVPMCRPCPGCPPFPPFISEGLPTFSRAAVVGAAISAWDPLTQAAVGNSFAPAPNGFFEVEGVPSRADVPFYMFSSGQGTTNEPPPPPAGPGFPAPTVVKTTYLPTVSTRPINTMFSTCTSQEAVVIGRNGVLEAVAKHLSVNLGRPTTVSDFMDPTRYHSVAVVVTHHAGNQALRAPADGISLEGTQGEVYVLNYANLPADNLRSARGFIVTNAAASPIGFNVVLIPATSPRPDTVSYKFKDTKTDSVARRPWQMPEIKEPPHAGVVTYIGAQMRYQPPPIPLSSLGAPPAACVPGVN